MALEGLPGRRERAVQRPRPEPQDRLRGRLPRRLLERPAEQIGVQDDLDDNTYEFTRRYFALTNYAGGILPPQYDPRFLILRRALSPITGHDRHPGVDRDPQARASTSGSRPSAGRRGGGGSSTTWPSTSTRPTSPTPPATTSASRSARTCTTTSGSSATGRASSPTAGSSSGTSTATRSTRQHVADKNDPFGLNIITSGVSITRPQGNIFLGYTIINTGPINTSALNAPVQLLAEPEVVRDARRCTTSATASSWAPAAR